MNKIMCVKCFDFIESTHRWNCVTCSCGAVSVDGGQDYKRRVGNQEDYIEVPSKSVERRLMKTYKKE